MTAGSGRTKESKRKGLAFPEMLMAVATLVLLAGVSIPSVLKARERASQFHCDVQRAMQREQQPIERFRSPVRPAQRTGSDLPGTGANAQAYGPGGPLMNPAAELLMIGERDMYDPCFGIHRCR